MKKSVLLLLLLVGCQKQAVKKNEVDADKHNAKNSLDYVGMYKGILPCADCQGLETEIAINENNTYSVKTKYQGKGEKVYVQKGTFTWNSNGTTIILKDVKNAPNQYFVGENTLTQLDISGQKIKGSLADDYILSKQPKDTSGIETVSENNAATVDLNSRIATTTVIQKVNPAIGKHTLAETKWKLVSFNGKKVVPNDKKVYFLQLNSKDGRFAAFAGCNSIGGTYAMPKADVIDFSDVIMTRMACPDMAFENQFGSMLVQVIHYKLDEATLTFYGEGKTTLAKFVAIK